MRGPTGGEGAFAWAARERRASRLWGPARRTGRAAVGIGHHPIPRKLVAQRLPHRPSPPNPHGPATPGIFGSPGGGAHPVTGLPAHIRVPNGRRAPPGPRAAPPPDAPPPPHP
ncbi:Hypothetical protein A7982_08299 [Minicystis rosea]|nr:Hypothetical protein A7982_08299 [Minicystis rosea]